MRLVCAALLLIAAPAIAADAPMTPAEATAVLERIRTTPAELKLHCEQIRLQGDSIQASMKGDMKTAQQMGMRINEIQGQLAGYRDAVRVVASKAGDMAFFTSPEGKALDKADKALAFACPKK